MLHRPDISLVSDSEEETLSMIRSVLTEEVPEAPARKSVAQRMTKRAAPEALPEPAPAPEAPARRASILPDIETEQPVPVKHKRPLFKLPALRGTIAKVRAFRPSTRHLAIVSLLLLLVIRPHWFVIGAVLMIAAVTGAFMTLGADRIWHRVMRRLDRIEATDPARANELRGKLDGFAYRWDGFLDLFPDGMVDSLYMPDFQSLGQSEERHTSVMSERLARMGQEG